MTRMLVMTVIGSDRPGLVESVAGLVTEHGGNWLESRMSRLGGQFAGILRVEVPQGREQDLLNGLKRLESQGLTVMACPDQAVKESKPRRISTLELVGQDRPGIVRQISAALASHGVNVEEFESECASAAMTGENLFKARVKVSIPDSCDTVALRKELERIAEDLIADISFAEAEKQPQT